MITRNTFQSALPLQLLADALAMPPVGEPLHSSPAVTAESVQTPETHSSQQLIDFQPQEVAEIWPDLALDSSSSQLEHSAALSKAEATQQAWKARRPTLQAAEISSHACSAQHIQCSCPQSAVLVCMAVPAAGEVLNLT